jgi:hypothetical protein
MKQKFSASDFNGDGKVDIVEFEAFQFPRYDLRTKAGFPIIEIISELFSSFKKYGNIY